MKFTQLFTKTKRDFPSDEIAKNAQLFIKAGYIHKTMAGVYSYLPLGLRMINKIENIVRKNLNLIGGQEILMNTLHPKEWWVKTNRWENVDILFKVKSQSDKEYAIACSHEEQVTPILSSYINSWKDLVEYNPESQAYPIAVYQIQTKFRDELRSKSGMLRGREFRMKDMYDFHRTKASADNYYELVKATYLKIYSEMGLQAYAVHASGGIFTSNDSHEFQVICSAGEDEIFYDDKTGYAINSEIIEEMKSKGENIPENLKLVVSAEVGNIFKLDDKYTKAFGITYVDNNNKPQFPIMNCHGIGTSRCMGVLGEIYSDEKGLKLPKQVAPFDLHLITQLDKNDKFLNSRILAIANRIYSGELKLVQNKNDQYRLLDTQNLSDISDFTMQELVAVQEVLWDDRMGKVSIGEKLKDADLLGMPLQLIVSKRSLENECLEVIERATGTKFEVRI
jgi:prolyl-tRNA synthetase